MNRSSMVRLACETGIKNTYKKAVGYMSISELCKNDKEMNDCLEIIKLAISDFEGISDNPTSQELLVANNLVARSELRLINMENRLKILGCTKQWVRPNGN